MRIEFDPSLVEKTVFLATRQDEDLNRDLHAQTDALYDIANDRKKRARFCEVYQRMFFRLGFAQPIENLIEERRVIADRIDQCFVREAARRKVQQAELFLNQDGTATTYTLFVDLMPDSLIDPDSVTTWLRRDLLHVVDMLDQDFGYCKQSLLGNSPRQNLIRDRFRVLWDIYVEGRLSREGRGQAQHMQRLSRQFERAFACRSVCVYSREFERVFQAQPLSHDQLIHWASDPRTLFVDSVESTSTKSGELCPICEFSTFDWCPTSELGPKVLEALHIDHPSWSSSAGICRLCAELYASRVALGSQLPEHTS